MISLACSYSESLLLFKEIVTAGFTHHYCILLQYPLSFCSFSSLPAIFCFVHKGMKAHEQVQNYLIKHQHLKIFILVMLRRHPHVLYLKQQEVQGNIAEETGTAEIKFQKGFVWNLVCKGGVKSTGCLLTLTQKVTMDHGSLSCQCLKTFIQILSSNSSC